MLKPDRFSCSQNIWLKRDPPVFAQHSEELCPDSPTDVHDAKPFVKKCITIVISHSFECESFYKEVSPVVCSHFGLMQFWPSLFSLIPQLLLPRLPAWGWPPQPLWHQGGIKSCHSGKLKHIKSNAFLVKLKHIKSNAFYQLFPFGGCRVPEKDQVVFNDIKSNAFLVKLKHITSNAFCQLFPFGGCWHPEKDQVVFNDSDDVFNWELEQGWSRPSEVVMVFCFC